MRYDHKSAAFKIRKRAKEVRFHLADLEKALRDGSITAANLAAIRLAVWADSLKAATGEEMDNFMADKAGRR